MAVTFVAAGTTGEAGSPSSQGDITPGLPTGWAENDIFLLATNNRSTESAIATPDGWTLIDTVESATSSGHARLQVWWRRATSSETAPTLDTDLLNYAIGKITAWRGVKTSGDPWNVKQTSFNGSSDSTVTITGNTTTVDGCMVVALTGIPDNNNTPDPQLENWANANLASIAVAYDVNTAFGVDGGIAAAYGILTSAGDTGDTTATIVGSATETEANLMLALEPAAGGGSSTILPLLMAYYG